MSCYFKEATSAFNQSSKFSKLIFSRPFLEIRFKDGITRAHVGIIILDLDRLESVLNDCGEIRGAISEIDKCLEIRCAECNERVVFAVAEQGHIEGEDHAVIFMAPWIHHEFEGDVLVSYYFHFDCAPRKPHSAGTINLGGKTIANRLPGEGDIDLLKRITRVWR